MCIIAAAYLGLMLLNIVVPTGLTSGRAYFNLDWITLTVMFVITVVAALYFFLARPDRPVAAHVHDELEPTGAEGSAVQRRHPRTFNGGGGSRGSCGTAAAQLPRPGRL